MQKYVFLYIIPMNGKLYKNMFKLTIIFFTLLLLCCKKDLHSAEKSAEPTSCQMSERCLVLLAYGVLSNDKFDVPFGGSCKDIASDSLVNFLESQKTMFNNSKNDSIDAKELIRQIEEKSKEGKGCRMSDCITLISYGLLSEKEIDIPFDGVCKGIVSDSITDSLSKYLNNEKNVFRHWQLDRVSSEALSENFFSFYSDVGSNERSERLKQMDINKLGLLIRFRIEIGPNEKECYNCADFAFGYAKDWVGDDVSFGWGLEWLDIINKSLTYDQRDSLVRILNFNDYAAYLDSLFANSPIYSRLEWCVEAEEAAKNLVKYSKDDFSLKYYYSRCQFKDDRDGKFYRINKMPDSKIWLAKNLDYKTEDSWCYDDDDSNCEKYGRLYNWHVALKACPNGWHLPTNDEWQAIIDSAGNRAMFGSDRIVSRNRMDKSSSFSVRCVKDN